MIRRPPRSTRVRSSAASDVYKRQYGYSAHVGKSVHAVSSVSTSKANVSRKASTRVRMGPEDSPGESYLQLQEGDVALGGQTRCSESVIGTGVAERLAQIQYGSGLRLLQSSAQTFTS